MTNSSRDVEGVGRFVRLGGAAILAGVVIHLVLNLALKEFPAELASPVELESYLQREAWNWSVIHGFRYVAFACIVLFAAALFVRISQSEGAGSARGWGVFGLLGAGIFVTNGVIANGVEILAFMHTPIVVGNQELFWLVFRLSRVLFTAEVVLWSFMILGFSVAGWLTNRLPRWLAILGFAQVAGGMSTGVFIGSVMAEGSALILADATSLLGLLWLIAAGFHMLTLRTAV